MSAAWHYSNHFTVLIYLIIGTITQVTFSILQARKWKHSKVNYPSMLASCLQDSNLQGTETHMLGIPCYLGIMMLIRSQYLKQNVYMESHLLERIGKLHYFLSQFKLIHNAINKNLKKKILGINCGNSLYYPSLCHHSLLD